MILSDLIKIKTMLLIIEFIIVFLTIVITIQVLEELVEYHSRLIEKKEESKKLKYNDGVSLWAIGVAGILWCISILFIF